MSTGTLALSVLDQCPRPDGATAAEAVRASIELARQAEELGYRRYWVAEHHNSPALACTTPAVLLAAVAGVTRRIRLGSGGVLLPYYSPLAVAEAFTLLQGLAPGRVDLGVGRAAGADPATEAALHHLPDGEIPPEDFAERVVELVGILDGAHALAGLAGSTPQVWVLGSSSQGAGHAAYLGLPFAFAHFITSRFGPQVVRSYRRGFRPRPGAGASSYVAVAVSVVCAPSTEEARLLAAPAELSWLRRGGVDRGPMVDPDRAAGELSRLSELEAQHLAQHRAGTLVGSPEEVATGLTEVATDHDADELVVLTNCHDPDDRTRSYSLLAEAWAAVN